MKRSPDEVAAALADRHARKDKFSSIFESTETPDLDFAYAVQDRHVANLCRMLSTQAGGYKIGLTTKRMQDMCGVGEPIRGVVLASRIVHAPAVIRSADFARLGIESEIALKVNQGISALDVTRPLPPLASFVDEVCAAFEIIEDNAADYKMLSAISIVADNSWNGGLVLGPKTRAADLQSLAGRTGTLSRNGTEVDKGSSSDVLGDPVNALTWLAESLRRLSRDLKPGDWVTTGSIVPTVFVKPGETYTFSVTGLAPVELTIA